jgi:hypothetical protein
MMHFFLRCSNEHAMARESEVGMGLCFSVDGARRSADRMASFHQQNGVPARIES